MRPPPESTVKVLDKASQPYGKPAYRPRLSVPHDRIRKVSGFKRHLENPGKPARVSHPQTSGKLECLHMEIQRKLHPFEDVAGPPGTCPINPESDPMARFMKRYNHDRPHLPPDIDIEEAPAMVFELKMPTPKVIISHNQITRDMGA